MFVCLKLLGTFVLGSLMLVSGVMLADKALTPIPQTPVIPPADKRLAEENFRLSRRCEQLECDNAVLKLNVETLMKVAVIPPAREHGPELIPAQHLPTVAMPTPAEVGVSP